MSQLIGITGASGSGQSTLVRSLSTGHNVTWVRTIATRPSRSATDEDEYEFISEEDLDALQPPERMWRSGHYGAYYSVRRSAVEQALAHEGIAVLTITPPYHQVLVNEFPNITYLGIHLLSPSREEQLRRLKTRGDMTPEAIDQRINAVTQVDSDARAAAGKLPVHLLEPDHANGILRRVVELSGIQLATAHS